MLTVMHMTMDGNKVYEALSVQEFPRGRTMHEGTEAERTQPPSVFIVDSESRDGSGFHLYEGTIYVMNSHGKTVATFEIQPMKVPLPADGEGDVSSVARSRDGRD